MVPIERITIVDPGSAGNVPLTYKDIPKYSFFYTTLSGERNFYFKGFDSVSCLAPTATWNNGNGDRLRWTDIELVNVEIRVIR